MAGMAANAVEHIAAPRQACAVSDFFAVLINANKQFQFAKGVRSDSARALLGDSTVNEIDDLKPSPGGRNAQRVPLRFSESVQRTAILRI